MIYGFTIFISLTTLAEVQTSVAPSFSLINEVQQKRNISSDYIQKVVSEIDLFAEKEKLEKKDISTVVNLYKTLILLKKHDPAQGVAQSLTASYMNNKTIYKAAAKLLNKSEQKEAEIYMKMWERLEKNGQG